MSVFARFARAFPSVFVMFTSVFVCFAVSLALSFSLCCMCEGVLEGVCLCDLEGLT